MIFLVKKACSNLPIVGLDLVEFCPDYVFNHSTANIAARILKEAMASIPIPNKKKIQMIHSVPIGINKFQAAINESVPYYCGFNHSNVSIGTSKKSPHN